MKKLQPTLREARVLKQKSGEWVITWYAGKERIRRKFNLNRIKDLAAKETEAQRIVSFINQSSNRDVDSIEKDIATLKHVPTVSSIQQKNSTKTFTCFLDEYIDMRIGVLSRGTTKVFKTVHNALMQYGNEVLGREMSWSDLDSNFLLRYQKWGYAAPRRWSSNYVSKHLDIVRQFLNDAKEQGIEGLPLTSDKKLRLKKTEPDAIALTMAEVTAIYELSLENKLHRAVRDAFVVGCLTGLRFSDLSKLSEANVVFLSQGGEKIPMLEVLTEKTGEKVLIPMHRYVKQIFSDRTTWRVPVNQVFNRYIKEVCQLAGLTQTVQLRENVAGKAAMKRYYQYEVVSAHTARRTFATVAYCEWELAANLIMKITGHRTEASFFRYIKMTKQQAAVKLAKFFEK